MMKTKIISIKKNLLNLCKLLIKIYSNYISENYQKNSKKLPLVKNESITRLYFSCFKELNDFLDYFPVNFYFIFFQQENHFNGYWWGLYSINGSQFIDNKKNIPTSIKYCQFEKPQVPNSL